MPSDPCWVVEARLTGRRLLARKESGQVRLLAADGRDWSARLPGVVAAIRILAARTAVLDGVVANQDGTPRYWVFDLLELNGWDLRACALPERKRLLAALDVLEGWSGVLRLSPHFEGRPQLLHRTLLRNAVHGIVCKRPGPYRGGASGDWLEFPAAAGAHDLMRSREAG